MFRARSTALGALLAGGEDTGEKGPEGRGAGAEHESDLPSGSLKEFTP